MYTIAKATTAKIRNGLNANKILKKNNNKKSFGNKIANFLVRISVKSREYMEGERT